MGGSGDLDFLSQIPIQIILAPIIFGALYIVAMFFIFRRAAERRRKAREAKNATLGIAIASASDGVLTSAQGPTPVLAGRSRLDRLAGAGAATGAHQGGAVPEPDLDLLLTPLPGAPAAAVAAVDARPFSRYDTHCSA